MAKIGILSLGGLDQKSNNLYLIEIDSRIYILESGINQPLNNNFGVQYFIPKLEYLKVNRDKIKGVFLSSAISHNIMAVVQISKIIPNIKIFGSKVTLDFIKLLFPKEEFNLNVLENNKSFDLEGQKITSFELTSSVPGTFGYIFDTEDGNIIYMINYIFDTIPEYNLSFKNSLNFLEGKNNFIFMSDSSNFNVNKSISPSYRISHILDSRRVDNNRLFLLVYEEDYINIVEALNYAIRNDLEVAFFSKLMFDFTSGLIKDNIVSSKAKISLIKDNYDNLKNKVIIISGNKTDLFRKVLKVFAENLFKFEKNSDVFLISSSAQIGNEHIYQEILNKISLLELDMIEMQKGEKKFINPTLFDLSNYISIISPKYFFPIKGLYKEMKKGANFVENLDRGIKWVISKNGEYNVFTNGEFTGNSLKIKEIGSQVIDFQNDQELNSEIISTRQELNSDGFFSLSFLIDEGKEVLSNIDIQMRGVVFVKNQEELMDRIKSYADEVMIEFKKNDGDFKKIKFQLRKKIEKDIKKTVRKTPKIFINIIRVGNN